MAAHVVEPPGDRDRRVAVAVGPPLWTARHCQRTGLARKGDPPRASLQGADGGGAGVHDRGDRADLPGSGDGDGGRASGCPSGPRLRSGGCSRRDPGRSACRWRRGPGSAGISPVSASPWGDPRPTVRRDEDTTDDVPGSGKTCDNPGWSSLCAFEDRGSSTRGLGAATPGPHLLLADGRLRRRSYALGAVDAGGATCDHCRVGAARRGSTFGRAGRSPRGQGPLDQEEPNPSPREEPPSAAGEMFRKGRFCVIVHTQ